MSESSAAAGGVSPERPILALKTYQYVRYALIGLVVLIALAVFIERTTTAQHCFQTSISAYYYTPAQGVFIAALVAIGVCLVALQGSTVPEDTLLNIAGMLAPIVAFVPTSAGDAAQCASVEVSASNINQNIANNLRSYLVVAAVVLLGVAVQIIRTIPEAEKRKNWIGFAATAIIYGFFAIWYLVQKSSLETHAHNIAAPGLFGAIVVVSVIYARRHLHNGDRWLSAGYAAIAALMVISAAVFGYLSWKTDMRLAILFLESSEIGLFAVFWILQTGEMVHLENGISARLQEVKTAGKKLVAES